MAGGNCADLCRKHGMSSGRFHAWKAKYGGTTVSDARRLKAFEDENAELKKPLAEQMLDAAAVRLSAGRQAIATQSAERRRLFVPLRREGEPSGINRIYRLSCGEGLALRRRRARRKAVGTRAPILVEARAISR